MASRIAPGRVITSASRRRGYTRWRRNVAGLGAGADTRFMCETTARQVGGAVARLGQCRAASLVSHALTRLGGRCSAALRHRATAGLRGKGASLRGGTAASLCRNPDTIRLYTATARLMHCAYATLNRRRCSVACSWRNRPVRRKQRTRWIAPENVVVFVEILRVARGRPEGCLQVVLVRRRVEHYFRQRDRLRGGRLHPVIRIDARRRPRIAIVAVGGSLR